MKTNAHLVPGLLGGLHINKQVNIQDACISIRQRRTWSRGPKVGLTAALLTRMSSLPKRLIVSPISVVRCALSATWHATPATVMLCDCAFKNELNQNLNEKLGKARRTLRSATALSTLACLRLLTTTCVGIVEVFVRGCVIAKFKKNLFTFAPSRPSLRAIARPILSWSER